MTSPTPSYTADDIPQLDKLHEEIGLGQEWLNSDRRAELFGHNMIIGAMGRECSKCWACLCHSKDFLSKPCLGFQLKKKEQQ